MCMTHTNHDSPTPRLSHRVAYMTTFHPVHECPSRAKSLCLPKVARQLPVVFNGNFGLDMRPRWTKRTRDQELIRDSFIAVDGRAAGASHREVAEVIFGHRRVSAGRSRLRAGNGAEALAVVPPPSPRRACCCRSYALPPSPLTAPVATGLLIRRCRVFHSPLVATMVPKL